MKKITTLTPLTLACIALLGSLRTQAATVVEAQPFAVPNTSGSALSFAPFNPVLGKLESVELALASSYSGTLDLGPFSSGTLTLTADSPQLSLVRTDTETCGIFTSCNENVSGSFNGSQTFVNPYLGVGTTNVNLSALTEGDMSGNWNGDVGLQYRYLPVGGGPLTTIDQQSNFSQSLNGSSQNLSLAMGSFDPGLGTLMEVTMSVDSSYSGNVETFFNEDPDILFSVGAPLLSVSQLEDNGNTCGFLFVCNDLFGGVFDSSAMFEDAYLGAAPITVTMDSNSDQFYTGNWSGTISITYQFLPAVVPEPSSLTLAYLSLLGIVRHRRVRA